MKPRPRTPNIRRKDTKSSSIRFMPKMPRRKEAIYRDVIGLLRRCRNEHQVRRIEGIIAHMPLPVDVQASLMLKALDRQRHLRGMKAEGKLPGKK